MTIISQSTTAAGNNWMAHIGNETSLAELSIPGSHDTCALYEPLPGTAKCQHLKLRNQLDAGVRFLDIRCRNSGRAFAIYHGPVSQRITFTQVFSVVTGFLKANPSEAVVMSIKEENSNTGHDFDRVFNTYVERSPNLWYLGSIIPKLGAVRGKIVLFRRFVGAQGIDASAWPDNATFTNRNLEVEDNYRVANATAKWETVVSHLNAAQSGPRSSLFITFASGFIPRTFGIPDITAVSTSINPDLAKYFSSREPGRYGIVVMDFVDVAYCAQIITTNPIK